MRRIALAVAGLLAATACRTPVPVYEPLPPGDPRPAALLADWTLASETRQGLRGRAKIAVDSDDGAVRLRASQILVLERPARLRVEIQNLLNQTVAVLVTDGERFELFRTDTRSYETGEVTPALLWEQAHLALRPEEAVDLLLGAPALPPDLRPGPALGAADGGVRLDFVDPEGRVRRRAAFDAERRLLWAEARDEAGRRLWRAEFRDYAELSGVDFAHVVALDLDVGGTRAEISLRDVELNPPLRPDIFRLRAPQVGGRGAGRDG